MATAVAEPMAVTKSFRFTENVMVDDLAGRRVQADKDLVFEAVLEPEKIVDRSGTEPKLVATGRTYVASSDVDISIGCLTSCIRTGRAEPADAKPKTAPTKPEPPKARKKTKK